MYGPPIEELSQSPRYVPTPLDRERPLQAFQGCEIKPDLIWFRCNKTQNMSIKPFSVKGGRQ